jgi:hypothetical protein
MRISRDRAGFPEAAVPAAPGADAVPAAISCEAASRDRDIRSARNCDGEKVSPRVESAGVGRVKLWPPSVQVGPERPGRR